MNDFGFLSVLPPIIAIVLAIATRQVIISLFIGLWLGASFYYANPATAFFRSVDTHILDEVTSPFYGGILIFTMLIAAALGLVTKSGGAHAIANALAKKATTVRGGMISGWLMGLIIFFDDYASCLIAGNTAKPVTDRLKISREKLSYLIDSTAAPIATIALISTWIGFELGVIGEGYAAIDQPDAPVYLIFLQSIPYRFYSIFAFAMVLIISITQRDYGPMYDAEVRARKTGALLREGALPLSATDTEVLQPDEKTPIRWYNFVVPVVVIIVATFIGLYVEGGGTEPGVGVIDAFGNADSSVVLLWSSSLGVLVTLVMVLAQRLVPLQEAIDTLINGAKSVFPALIILSLAWGLSNISDHLGTADYLVALVEAAGIAPAILPLLIFLLSCFMAFAMGTSWGVMGIVTPLAIPIAAAIGPEELIIPTLASVLTGAIFGDHCSPLSDTTILSSTGAGADHIDHVNTQIPYAITAAIVAAVFGFIPAGLGLHPVISIVLGIAALIIVVRLLGKPTGTVEEIDASSK